MDAWTAPWEFETGPSGMLARGVCRALRKQGFGTLTEFGVVKGRRVDVIGLDRFGRFVIVEIKASEADFRGDRKWRDYLPYCDWFYFAVPQEFRHELLPQAHGLMVADGFDAAVLRAAPETPMNGTRRRAQLLRFGLAASQRLHRTVDPPL